MILLYTKLPAKCQAIYILRIHSVIHAWYDEMFSSVYLRNKKHFPCFYRVIETHVKAWEKREIAWEHEQEVRVFPRNLEFLPNFHKCFYKLYRNTEKMFSISFIKCPFKKNKKDKFIDFYYFHSNISYILIYVRVKNN
jgi:hypothetical protein